MLKSFINICCMTLSKMKLFLGFSFSVGFVFVIIILTRLEKYG